MKKIYIIGCGGAASYLLPPLRRMVPNAMFILVDGDILEERNLDRQLFTKNMVGKNKAEALAKVTGLSKYKAIPKYLPPDPAGIFDTAFLEDDSVNSTIFACVDNHIGRCSALSLAEFMRCPIILSGNEYFTAQAMYYSDKLPEHLHPLKRYPEIKEDKSNDPLSNCTGEAAVSAAPQLPLANATSAILALNLFCLWEDKQAQYGVTPYEFQTTFGTWESVIC